MLLALLLTLVLAASAWADITTGLVLDLPLEEGTGGAGATVVNLVPGSNNGVLGASTAAPTWTTGRVGRSALQFDGSNDLVTMTRYAAIDGLTTWTFACWFQSATLSNASGMLFMKGTGSTATSRFVIAAASVNPLVRTIRLRIYNSGTTMSTFSSDNVWTADQWTHLIVTSDGTLTSANQKIYVNNVETSYQTPTNGTGTINADSTFDVNMGREAGGSNPLNGRLNHIRLYNRVLSAADRDELYHHHKNKRRAYHLR